MGSVRYLKPPDPPKSGDIIIEELPPRQVAPAPILIEHVQSVRAVTPPPIIIREAPPEPPQPLPGRTIYVPGKVYAPPARKVVIEKLAPEPAKPPKIIIERWLPYEQPTQRVIFKPAKPCIVPVKKNVLIECWQTNNVEVKNSTAFRPQPCWATTTYTTTTRPSLLKSETFHESTVRRPGDFHSICHRNLTNEIPMLEAHINALNLIDIHRRHLNCLRNRLLHGHSTWNVSSACDRQRNLRSLSTFRDDTFRRSSFWSTPSPQLDFHRTRSSRCHM
jgi:hypothetical protein